MQDGEYVDGKKDGPWVAYFADGTRMSEGHYRAGRKVGRWTLYHPNGHKKSEATFEDGKYVGLYTAYHENGNRRLEGRYTGGTGTSADGTKEGVWCEYEPDGRTVRRRLTYHRGSRARPDEWLTQAGRGEE